MKRASKLWINAFVFAVLFVLGVMSQKLSAFDPPTKHVVYEGASLGSGSYTWNQPVLNLDGTFNNAAALFHPDDSNWNFVAALSSSTIIRRQVNGTPKFEVFKNGQIATGLYSFPDDAGQAGYVMTSDGSGHFKMQAPSSSGGNGNGWSYSAPSVSLTAPANHVGIGFGSPSSNAKFEVNGDSTYFNINLSAGSGGNINLVSNAGGHFHITDNDVYIQDHSFNTLFTVNTTAGAVYVQDASGGIAAMWSGTTETRLGGTIAQPTQVSQASTLTFDTTAGTWNANSATAQTFILPNATACAGRTYRVKQAGAGTLTLATTSSQNIDAATTFVFTKRYQAVDVQSDGVQWWIYGNPNPNGAAFTGGGTNTYADALGSIVHLKGPSDQALYIQSGTGRPLILEAPSGQPIEFSANGALSVELASTIFSPFSAGGAQLGIGGQGWAQLFVDYTNTGTVGDVTINKASGRVNLGAGSGSLTVTDSMVTSASHIFLNADSAPGNAVAVMLYAVPGNGSFVVNAVPVVTNQTAVDFFVVNAD